MRLDGIVRTAWPQAMGKVFFFIQSRFASVVFPVGGSFLLLPSAFSFSFTLAVFCFSVGGGCVHVHFSQPPCATFNQSSALLVLDSPFLSSLFFLFFCFVTRLCLCVLCMAL